MTKITTDLTVNYFDDYDEDKKFVKILFKPAKSVQTRELNQLQTILQNQISRFSDHIFKEGSIVKGVALTYNPTQNFVHLVNTFDANTLITTSSLTSNNMLYSNTGIRAVPVISKDGFSSQYPATNIVYLNYITTGKDGSNNDITTFTSGETLTLFDGNQSKLGALDANNIVDTISVLTANGTANSTGTAYTTTCSDGIVYQKGYFSKVSSQVVLVKPYDTNTANYSIGFETTESIITNLQDATLVDNALGEPNDTAPGADRLKLDPVLVSVDKTTLDSDSSFFAIAEFNDNSPVEEITDGSYSILGEQLAKRTYEESGNYVLKPFIVESLTHASNSSLMYYEASPGIGYVQGDRVELIGTRKIEVERATTTDEAGAQIITANFGNYVIVDEFVGNFDIDNLGEVTIYDEPQNALSTVSGAGSAPSGNNVGTASVRSSVYSSGTKGTGDAQYLLYLFNISMASGKSFSADAKSFYINGTYGKAKADIVLDNGASVVRDSSRNKLTFDTGISAIKRLTDSGGVNDTQFIFRDTVSGTLQANGFISFTLNTPYAGGNEKLNASVGTLSDTNELKYDISLSTEAYSANQTGTISVSANTVTGVATLFDTEFAVNDYIRVPGTGDTRLITAIASNTSMTINATTTASGAAFQKYWPQGYVIDTSSTAGSMEIVSNTQFTVSSDLAIDSGTQTVYTNVPVLRTAAVATTKDIKKSTYVKIDANTAGVTGPYNLGLVDVTKIKAVYTGATYDVTNPDRKSWFYLDNGQTSAAYDHSKLVINPNYASNITASTKLLIELDHFVANNTTGAGFFSVDSYPIKDDGDTANSTNYEIGDIPLINGVDARSIIDFRPQKYNTANTATSVGVATENPAASNSSFIMASTGSYIPEPDSNFQADVEFYLPRKDLLSITQGGDLVVTYGEANQNPVTPIAPQDSMVIANISVPAYPSLTSRESAAYSRSNLKTKISLSYNKRYTMRDIGVIDKRLKTLEYYTALNLLEQETKDLVIPDAAGLDRFKNGFFVEPFASHSFGRVNDFEYRIAIDPKYKLARPYYNKHAIDFQYSNTSANVQVSGYKVTRPYTATDYISQIYATKVRNCTESIWKWSGAMTLYPEYDHYKDETADPAVNIDIDLASPWEDFASSPFASNFGEWRTINVDTNTTTDNNGFFNNSTTTTATTQSQDVLGIDVDVLSQSYDLGSYVTDISLNPYMRSREVAFIVYGLKPDTEMHAFFERDNVDAHVATGTLSGVANVLEGQENRIITRDSAWGTTLVSDSSGTIYGVFRIPDSSYRVGDREFIIANVDDLLIGTDAILSSARAVYTASSMSVTTQETNITTSSASISSTSDTITRTNISTTTSSVAIPVTFPTTQPSWVWATNQASGGGDSDPISQSFLVTSPASTTVFIDKIGVYFKTKDPTLGVTVYLAEMENGFPNTKKIIAKKYMASADVNTSATASTETVFDFDDVIALQKDTYYAFMVKPDGDSPEYTIWMAELGGTDVATSQQVFSNPYIGVSFISANMNTWTALQTEDIKFNIYRASFTVGTGTAVFENEADDYISIDGLTKANSSIGVEVGDIVYTANSTGGLLMANSDPVAYIQRNDEAINELILNQSTGGFTANTDIQIHRQYNAGETTFNANTLIASGTIDSILNKQYSVIVPRYASMTPAYTSISYGYKGTDTSYITDASFVKVTPESDNERTDKMRMFVSKSNEVDNMSSAKSSFYNISLSTASDWVSPVLDMRRKSSYGIENLINNDNTDESTRYGNALSRYVSKEITLAESQDAEDLRVWLSAWRPVGSDIEVYGKFLNGEDYDSIDDKVWTKLTMDSGSLIYGSASNSGDIREYEFTIPSAAPVTYAAYTNPDIMQYTNSTGSVFIGYKSFMIKVVFLSSSKALVPHVHDIRAICLQV